MIYVCNNGHAHVDVWSNLLNPDLGCFICRGAAIGTGVDVAGMSEGQLKSLARRLRREADERATTRRLADFKRPRGWYQ